MLAGERTADFAASLKHFSEAIRVNKKDKSFVPAMVVVYADRLAYRLQEHETSLEWLDRFYGVINDVPFDKQGAALRMQVIPRYFVQLKREQQDVLWLVDTKNDTIRNAPQTLTDLEVSLSRYESLLASARRVLEDVRGQVKRSSEDRLFDARKWEQDMATWIDQLLGTLNQYESDLPRLKGKVNQFAVSQASTPIPWMMLVGVLIAGGVVAFLIRRRHRRSIGRSRYDGAT
jgi:hypothetical protein